jgi:hypothetical protein
MKKIVALILAFYVLALLTIPCIDVLKDNQLHKTELACSSSDHQNDHANHCSPFCTCDCCVSPIINNSFFQFSDVLTVVQKLTTVYNVSFVSSIFASIWQPPKLS